MKKWFIILHQESLSNLFLCLTFIAIVILIILKFIPEVLQKSFEKVNDQQVESDTLTQKIVFDPNSVDSHQVMIAAEKARISLTFTKTMIDGVVKAYRDLSNLR